MRRRFDTLFVRLALTSLAVVMLVQTGSMAIMIVQRPRHDIDGYARGVLLVLETAHMHEPGTSGSGVLWAGIPILVIPDFDGVQGIRSRLGGEAVRFARTSGTRIVASRQVVPVLDVPGFHERTSNGMPVDEASDDELDDLQADEEADMTSSSGQAGGFTGVEDYASAARLKHHARRVRYVEVSASEARAVRGAPSALYSGLVHVLKTRLPTGTEIRFDKAQPANLWARFPGSARWIVTPIDPPPTPPFLIEFSAMTLASIVLALLAAWQLQLPVARVAQAARAFGRARRLPPVEASGPRELRELATSFNDMMKRVEDAESNQAVMLAGVAHDLKSPLMRLRLRADLLGDSAERTGFLRDVDSLTHIVDQFLLFANEAPPLGPLVRVDDSLRAQFGDIEAFDIEPGHELFRLGLHAGDGFELPRTLLDRLIGNLVDNALDHGEPPVDITTQRSGADWIIEVRDYGEGIAADKISEALLPFVRLDSSRGGDGHCGLGLAIVNRLVQQHGGDCTIRNATDGGLVVTLRLPANARA
jgi:two-component system, OmpR family, osmolarity sensor histidine kinase EnvZ